MTRHTQRKWVRHSADEMLALVMDVKRYPEFLPWCTGTRIKTHDIQDEQEFMTADMMIAFKMVREKFTSQVDCNRQTREINIQYIDGPFEHLQNRWRFEQNEDGTCTIDFLIDFEFKSRALKVLISALFDEAVRRMVDAFEKRADRLYGPSSQMPGKQV